MKKILIISLEYPPIIGGIASYTHSLARALDPATTVVLAPKHTQQKQWDDAQPYTVIRANFFFPFFFWPRWLRLFFIVWRIVKTHHVELLMIHHVLPVGYAGILMQKMFGVPFLLFSHGTDLIAGTQRAWKKRMVSFVSRGALQIIFNSISLQKRYLRVLPEYEQKSLVMYPCPDKIFSTPPPAETIERLREKYALRGKQVLVSVSRIADGKGFPHLVRILPRVLKEVPNVVWFIIGDGPKRGYVIDQIRKQNLQNIVRFLGEIPHEELPAYYYLGDIFVLLTHPDNGKEEGLGLVFLEAAAAGMPVVAGKSGGVEEAVIHGETGIVADVYLGDEVVARTLVGLLRDTEGRHRLGRAAQERIAHEFVWQKQLKKLSPWIL